MAVFEYRTKDGDVLDQICFDYYGKGYNVSPLPYVYDANPGLADIGSIFPAGMVILLPDLPAATKTTSVTLPWN